MGGLLVFALMMLAITLHELGHYWVMRWCGVKATQFAVGFGPSIVSHRAKDGCVFHLRLIPLGGYVMPMPTGQGSVEEAGAGARFCIYMAGMIANVLSALIVFWVLFSAFNIPPLPVPEAWKPMIASIPYGLRGFVIALVGSFGFWIGTLGLLFKGLMDSGIEGAGLVGPVGIVQIGQTVIAQAPSTAVAAIMVARLFAFLSLGVASFNLLPLPPLDGGKVMILLVEKLAGKRLPAFERAMNLTGTLLLLALFVYVMFKDVIRAAVG